MQGRLFTFMKKLLSKRFSYFVLAVIFLRFWADHYTEARRETIAQNTAEKQPVTSLEKPPIPRPENAGKTDSIVNFALSLKGTPYIYAGKSPDGFDCSGFIYYVFNHFGIEIPAGSANQYLIGEAVDYPEISKGDLLFFVGTQKGSKTVGHVGLVISEKGEEILFIHSSSGGGGRGVTINSLEHPHYKARFLGTRRVASI